MTWLLWTCLAVMGAVVLLAVVYAAGYRDGRRMRELDQAAIDQLCRTILPEEREQR
jgi:hypothetical protein